MSSESEECEDGSPRRKRQKTSSQSAPQEANSQIQSLEDLRRLLVFEQDASPHTEQKIQTFRNFLRDIENKKNEEQALKRKILSDYLKSQIPLEEEQDRHNLPELIQTWHFAKQLNNENLFSTLTAVLTLLLKKISSWLDIQAIGNSFCRILLHDNQLELFNRGLSAHRLKENLICPCLRLLTEIVMFDGGNAAKIVYQQRETTFQRLDVFLTTQGFPKHAAEKGKKSSLRDSALGFLLANISLQSHRVKSNILNHGKLIQAMLRDIAGDHHTTVVAIITALRRDIVLDGELPHTLKIRFFSERTLQHLATLYSYREAYRDARGQTNVRKSVHELLLLVCTSKEYGLLSMTAEKQFESHVDHTSGRHEDIDGQGYFLGKRNSFTNSLSPFSRIANFLQSLRPFADTLQSEIILACFNVSPELVGRYFTHKTSLSFEPKLTATWIGYSQFLLATVQLPVTESVLHLNEHGPSIASLLGSILPQPLTRKVLTRCLNQSSSLVTFFAIRILAAAFDKIERYIQHFKSRRLEEHRGRLSAANDTTSEVLTQFCSICPEMKHVVAQFRACPKENAMLREIILRLLASYYKMTPELALEEKFDISTALLQSLNDMGQGSWADKDGVKILELEHLLEIARRSPNMQWWHKPNTMTLSPFTTLLKMHVSRRRIGRDDLIDHLLNSVMMENCILKVGQVVPPLEVLVFSFQRSAEVNPSDRIFQYFDNCVLRFVRKAVQYQDLLEDLLRTLGIDEDAKDIWNDPFLFTLIEQWPFFEKHNSLVEGQSVAQWLNIYLKLLLLVGGNERVLSNLRERLELGTKDKRCRALFRQKSEPATDNGLYDKLLRFVTPTRDVCADPSGKEIMERDPNVSEAFFPQGPSAESEDHPGLVRWSREDVQDAITDGALRELLSCLSSIHLSVREQAVQGLCAFKAKLEASEYTEWRQIDVLLGELIETAKAEIYESPLPCIVSCVAANLALVLADPLHLMYTKVNKFLNEKPQWNIQRLPLHWIDKILLHPPTGYDGHYEEYEWILDILFDGLRSPADMDIYRKCNIFTLLLSISTSSSLPATCLDKMIDLIYRCTFVEGSTALTTRSGFFDWLASQVAHEGANNDRFEILTRRVYETCDQVRVDKWSSGSISSQMVLRDERVMVMASSP